jgi:hypothetical protein
MFWIVGLLILLCIFTQLKEGYLNYQELSQENNCPQIHASNYQKIKNSRQMIQPFGYTKNELFHATRFIKTDVPLPTDPDFFKHI